MVFRGIARILSTLALFGGLAVPAAADTAADFYRGKVVKLVVGYGAGGGYDAYARMLAPHLEQRLGATVVVENRPGGGGMVAISQLAAGRGDGLTVVLANLEAAALGQVLDSPGIRFDLTEMPVLARVAAEPKILLLGASSPFRSLADLQAATRPVKWAGGGKTDGIADNAAVLSRALDLNARIIIGYKGGKEAALAAIRGEVDGLFASADTAGPLTANGDLLPVAVLDRARSPLFPGLPTVFEAVSLSDGQAWWIDYRASLTALGRSLIAAPGLAEDRLAFLRAAVAGVLNDPAVIAEAGARQRPLLFAGPEEMEGLIRETVGAVTAEEIALLRDTILERYY